MDLGREGRTSRRPSQAVVEMTSGNMGAGLAIASNVRAAQKLLASGRLPMDAVVVTVLCDTGLKYGRETR